MLIPIGKVLLYLIALLHSGIFHKAYIQNSAMADTIIGIAIALHQAVVACKITRLRMMSYGTFEIHSYAKNFNTATTNNTLVYYKLNKAFILAMKILHLYLPTNK